MVRLAGPEKELKLSTVMSSASRRPKVANQDQPGISASSSSSASFTGRSPSPSLDAIVDSFAFSLWRRAACAAAYTPASRFFERKFRLTLDLSDFAIDLSLVVVVVVVGVGEDWLIVV